MEKDLRAVVRDIELLFDDATHETAADIFKNTTLQNMFLWHARECSEDGDEKMRKEAVNNAHSRREELSEKLPELEALLVRATRVGHTFR